MYITFAEISYFYERWPNNHPLPGSFSRLFTERGLLDSIFKPWCSLHVHWVYFIFRFWLRNELWWSLSYIKSALATGIWRKHGNFDDKQGRSVANACYSHFRKVPGVETDEIYPKIRKSWPFKRIGKATWNFPMMWAEFTIINFIPLGTWWDSLVLVIGIIRSLLQLV